MKFLQKNGGIALIFMGVLMLVVLHMLHFTFINALLLLPLLLIVCGIVWHIVQLKRQSPY